jgi:hypothetical protein
MYLDITIPDTKYPDIPIPNTRYLDIQKPDIRYPDTPSPDTRYPIPGSLNPILWAQALDPRTRMVLFKMISSNVITEVNGCVSTGKEANVYHASTPDGLSLAIKVFKTSILVFRDRDRCVMDTKLVLKLLQ